MARLAFETLEASVLLLAAAGALVAFWYTRHFARRTMFWLLAGVGTFVLAIDESAGIHERLGHDLYRAGFREPAPINHLDDLILIGLVVAAVPVLALGVAEMRRDARILRTFVLSACLFAAAVGWDALASTKGSASWWFEESLELVAGSLLAGTFWFAALAPRPSRHRHTAPADEVRGPHATRPALQSHQT